MRRTDSGEGWINRRFAKLERQIRELAAAKTLQAATIGKGGLRVKNGGAFTVEDGGAFTGTYPDNSMAAAFGPHQAVTGDTVYGVAVRTDTQGVIFAATYSPTTSPGSTFGSQGLVQVGGIFDNRPSVFFYTDYATLNGTQSVGLESGNNRLAVSPSGFFVNDLPTTAAAANVAVNAVTGELSRSTSSRRYKTDIVSADVDVDAVLALQPRRFRSKAEVETLGDDAPEHVGFIAEEAHNLGLDDWVTSDAHGPESFSYATWGVALQATCQRQAEQIADLTARLEALEGQAP